MSSPAAGTTKDAEDVSGTVTVPEVAHDTEEDEYVVRSLAFTPRQPFDLC